MERHAGFAAVATVTESIVNGSILAFCKGQLGPLFFPLPTSLSVGPVTVTFGGIVEMRPPMVELHENPDNLVTVKFTFLSTLRAQLAGQPMQAWTVQLRDTVTMGIFAKPQNKKVILGIDTQQVVFQPLAVQVLNGPPIPMPILNALQSPALAAIATNFVQSLPPLTASPPLLSSEIKFSQPSPGPWYTGEWFAVKLSASNIAIRVLDLAVSIGVDLSGPVYTINAYDQKVPTSEVFTTFGDPNALVNLATVKGNGSVYIEHFTQETDPSVPPFLSRKKEPKGGAMALAINMKFLSEVVAKQISPQVPQPGISVSPHPEITLESIGVGYSTFHTFDGSQDGLAIKFKVGVAEGPGFEADGKVFLQAYLRTADGTTGFVYSHPDTWFIYIAKVDIDVPAWVDIAIIVLTASFSIAMPLIAPMIIVSGIALMSEIATVVESAEGQTQYTANRLPFPSELPPPPGLKREEFCPVLKYVSFTPESIDLAIDVYVFVVEEEPRAKLLPDSWQATNTSPIKVTLKLRDDFEKLGGKNLMLDWNVRRQDTGEIVVSEVKAYNDPGGNGISIPHHNPQLYAVDAFDVRCRATLTVGDQVGELWTGKKTIPILDKFDRHHKYIKWYHPVYFRNAGTGNKTWSRERWSRIHRIAVSARCKMLQEVGHEFGEPLKYMDKLPFAWDQLSANRKPLCEYCFFGGPDKTVPFPEEDWF